jgi:primosomal protein N' (replication factor Y)
MFAHCVGGVALIVRVAVAAPVRRSFDYLVPANLEHDRILPGCRVRVPFGPRSQIGIVLERSVKSSVPHSKLKTITELLDPVPLLPPDILALLSWAASYYHHPIGDVLVNTLPSLLRQGRPALARTIKYWRINANGAAVDIEMLARRASRQSALLSKLKNAGRALGRDELALPSTHWPKALAGLVDKGWVDEELRSQPASIVGAPRRAAKQLSVHQQKAIDAVDAKARSFETYVLDGVTGSGKTEVYIQLIQKTIARGQQAMVLVPEIGLTPQTVARFEGRFDTPLSILHSGLSDQQRLRAWLMARDGSASVVIGTRSAAFAPLKRPGLFIVDEEHDTSYKQQDGFRYSARDLLVMRARRAKVPIVLGSATPSLESLNNVQLGRYKRLVLPERVAGARTPSVTVVDVRAKPFEHGLSQSVATAIQETLERGEQSLLFLNRRGYAPALLCHACGWVADCHRCDAHMVYHQSIHKIRCHHCGVERREPDACPECSAPDLRSVGVGTQRVAEGVMARFPAARVARLDRDSTQRKGELEAVLADVQARRVDILVGTQMLAKGHHFPHVTLVAVLDADGGLFGVDFRASERMAQLLVQVAGRAGRSQHPGRVLIQTHHPDHPLLAALLHRGYGHFAEAALLERQSAMLPPCASLALLRAEAASRELGFEFLESARRVLPATDEPSLMLLGPVPAPMERRAGRYRAHLLVQCEQRGVLHRLLGGWVSQLETLKQARRVRWSLDVDPQDMI